MLPPGSWQKRKAEITELNLLYATKKIEPLNSIEISRVDALCLGPAEFEANSRYHAIWPINWWKLSQVEIIKKEI